MPLDPGTMMLLSSLITAGAGMLTGNKGETGSTYSKGSRSSLEDAVQSLKGMKGSQDITQNPNYQSGQNWLQDLFNDPNFFNSFEAPLQRQFQEETIPNLANRFAGVGSGGGLGSGAFQRQLAREGGNLHSNIAALRGGMQQQGVNQSLQYAQQPFSNYAQLLQQIMTPTQNTYQGPTAGIGALAAPFAQGASSIWANQAGQLAANPGHGQSNFQQPQPMSRGYQGQGQY